MVGNIAETLHDRPDVLHVMFLLLSMSYLSSSAATIYFLLKPNA
jgi:hypothetical protein